LQKPEEKGEDEDDGHGSQAAFAGGAVVFFVGAVLVEGVGVFFKTINVGHAYTNKTIQEVRSCLRIKFIFYSED
jgi:hypothetical protein